MFSDSSPQKYYFFLIERKTKLQKQTPAFQHCHAMETCLIPAVATDNLIAEVRTVHCRHERRVYNSDVWVMHAFPKDTRVVLLARRQASIL